MWFFRSFLKKSGSNFTLGRKIRDMRTGIIIKVGRGEALLWTLWLAKQFCRIRILRGMYLHVLVWLIARTALFDYKYYLQNNPDVPRGGKNALRHYAAYGDMEGRPPMPLFDPRYYRARASGRTRSVNALLHYAYIGRYRRISPSPWFDVQFYLSQNRDVVRDGIEPLTHYLMWGGLEGRSPNPQFDGAFYLETNPELQELRINPLLHYMQTGRLLEKAPRRAVQHQSNERVPACDAATWKNLAINRNQVDEPLVDVVVPVYRDRELTLRCLHSVLSASNETPFELVVIDDCGPELELRTDLEQLAARGLFTLLHNDSNRGFVYTANRGMSLHPERDVVLLNSDTEVYNDWLDRLRAAAQREVNIATVTPLSNNATICSYPRFLHDSPYPLEISYADLDLLAREVNRDCSVETPSGVGFCIYLRREALDELGNFDEVAFGKGYGEENDYCQRAIHKGWRNMIAADTYVRHFGGASFQGKKAKRVDEAMKLLVRRYPNYQAAVNRFIRRDPLAEARRRLDWARLRAQMTETNMLLVCHNRGGGSERFVQEDSKRIREQGEGVFYLRPVRGFPEQVRICHPDCRQLLNVGHFRLADTEALAEALANLRIGRIKSHGLVDFEKDAPRKLLRLARAMNVPLHVSIHDYKVICPRLNLTDENGRYCGEPAERECDICLAARPNIFGAKSIRRWRHQHHQVLRACEEISVPDPDVSDRLRRYFPDLKFRVVPHEKLNPAVIEKQSVPITSNAPLRIVVIGNITQIKGYDVLLACARNAKKRGLLLEFVVMGFSYNDSMLRRADVYVTGRYQEQEAAALLNKLAPHAVWLPSIWPETYSYTLSLALKGEYDVFAFDLGAIAHRLREAGLGNYIWPLSSSKRPKWINDQFIKYREAKIMKEGEGVVTA